MKKIISLLLTLATLVGMLAVFAVPASAASTTAFDILTSSKYAKVYTLSSSGRTTPYTNTNLTTRGSVTYGKSSTAYIDNKTDELYLLDAGKNSKGTYWAKVSYPIGSKRAVAYIPLSAITNNNGSHTKTTSTGKFYCSYRSGVGTSTSYFVAKGDTVYLLSSTSGNTYQILYPISGGKWRIGFCSKANYDKYCAPKTNNSTTTQTTSTSTSKFITPVKGNYNLSRPFGHNINNGQARSYHLGMDYIPKSGADRRVYAFGAGTVVKRDWSNANGNFVIIKHTINNKAVYSFYGHLYSVCVSENAKVSAGTEIGVVGQTGSTGNRVDHLHFAVVDKLWTGGDYWGYSTKFSGNKTTYDRVTYFNPAYIIQHGKLPA